MSKGEESEDEYRMVIKVTKEGHPELFHELSTVGRFNRAERLRTLATMSVWKSQASEDRPPSQAQPAQTEGKPKRPPLAKEGPELDPEAEERRLEQERLEAKRRSFKDSLKIGFNEE